MSDLSALKARMNNSALAGAMAATSHPESTTKNYTDDRYWKLKRGKDGNGSALIRFLDVAKADIGDPNNLPYIKIYEHSFAVLNGEVVGPKVKGARWYIEKSLSTFGEPDIMSEENSRLWQTGLESQKKIASARKRRLTFTSNILVLKDPENPENEGKVFLYQYGKQIFDLINEQMNPPEDPLVDVQKVGYSPFCFWKGANFVLKIRTPDDAPPTYDKSTFQEPSPLFNGDDTKIAAVWEKAYSLQELLDRKHFKTPEELKKRFDFVYGISAPIGTAAEPAPAQNGLSEDVPNFSSQIADKTAPKPSPISSDTAMASAPFDMDDDDDDLKFFEKLASGE